MNKLTLDSNVYITSEPETNDHKYVCKNLYEYNVKATNGKLRSPGLPINLYLKSTDGQVLGGIFCDTFLQCLYIDVLWVHEDYRGKNYGKALITEAERLARKYECFFAHTCTFSYQSPEFYQKLGYEIFGVIEEYPDEIKQYFLKKKL